ncbi:hypothetical protein V6N13_082289 [Hibiscus sabdariffa]
MMRKLHSQGTSIDDIVAVLRRTPTHPRIIQAIKSAHELGCDLKIVSDVNVFFIDTISEHHGLRECFSEIHTNPSFVDEEGRIRIFPLHDLGKHPHGCHHPCPPNMCKGIVIERIQASLSAMDEKKTIVYMSLTYQVKRSEQGVDYYALPVVRGSGGGLALYSPDNETLYPLVVVQQQLQVSTGLPLYFSPVNVEQSVIRESTDLNVLFNASSMCTMIS